MFAGVLAMVVLGATDIGYNMLFEDSLASVDTCLDTVDGTLPELDGFWLITSAGKFSMGDRKFVASFDVFGKIHRFDFSKEPGKVCYKAQLMPTKFYQASVKKDTIDAGILFHETDPPRDKCLDPLCNLLAPNDNAFVNTIRLSNTSKTFCSLTDSSTWQDFNPKSLDGYEKHKYKDHAGKTGDIGALGPAHPLPRPGHADTWISIVQSVPAMDVAGDPSVMVFALTGGSPNTRQAIATYTPPYLPYFHSFGVHEDFALTIHQPVTVDFKVVEKTGILGNAFVDLSLNGTKNQFYILPFGDAAGTVEIYNSSESFFHLHTLNMFYGENSTVVVDCEVYDKFLFTNPTLTVPGSTNKTIRDGYSNFGGIKRFIIDRKAGTVSEGKKFSADKTFTTFPVINNKYHGKRYCIYYATEMFHNHVEFGSYAIVKMNICTGKRSYWFEEGHFQSEATFVPSKVPDADEDAGVLVFIDLHGATGNSSLITLNAKTMKTTSTTPLPARVPFTLHGEWYN